jgi:hypothetical protein
MGLDFDEIGLGLGFGIITVVLCILIILSILGVNVLIECRNALGNAWIFIADTLNIFWISVGDIINLASSVVSAVPKTNTAVTDGAMKGSSANVDVALMKGPNNPSDPKPTPTKSESLQWCLVKGGNDGDKHTCVEVSSSDKCDSGKLFENETKCILSS